MRHLASFLSIFAAASSKQPLDATEQTTLLQKFQRDEIESASQTEDSETYDHHAAGLVQISEREDVGSHWWPCEVFLPWAGNYALKFEAPEQETTYMVWLEVEAISRTECRGELVVIPSRDVSPNNNPLKCGMQLTTPSDNPQFIVTHSAQCGWIFPSSGDISVTSDSGRPKFSWAFNGRPITIVKKYCQDTRGYEVFMKRQSNWVRYDCKDFARAACSRNGEPSNRVSNHALNGRSLQRMVKNSNPARILQEQQFPEVHCCACGGGTSRSDPCAPGAPAPPAPPAPTSWVDENCLKQTNTAASAIRRCRLPRGLDENCLKQANTAASAISQCQVTISHGSTRVCNAFGGMFGW